MTKVDKSNGINVIDANPFIFDIISSRINFCGKFLVLFTVNDIYNTNSIPTFDNNLILIKH